MTKNQKILIQLVKYALKGEKLPDEYRNLSTEEKKSVIEFSREQALVPFLQYYDMFSTEDVRNMFISYFASYIFQDSRQSVGTGRPFRMEKSISVECHWKTIICILCFI